MGRCVGWMLAWQGKMNFIDELLVQPTGTYLSPANFTLHPSTPRDARIWGEEMEDQHSHHISHPARVSKIALTQQYSNYSVVFLRYVL